MTAISRSTRKLQIGRETVAGTKVAATTVLDLPVEFLVDERIIEHIPSNIGVLPPTNRTAQFFLGGSLPMPSHVATFQQSPYIMQASIKHIASGSADGVGSGKIYSYDEPITGTPNTIATYSLEAGDASQAEVGEYGFVEEWEMSGEARNPVYMTAKWRVRQVATQAFTAALTVPNVSSILMDKAKLYIDDAGGSIGTTQKTNTLCRFSLKKSGGWRASPAAGDGNLYFPEIGYTDPKYTLDITFLHDTHSQTVKTKWRAQTGVLLQLLFQGNALATPGTAYSYETLILQMAGKWLEPPKVDEQDGFDVVTGTLEAMRDATASLFFKAIFVNELATLP